MSGRGEARGRRRLEGSFWRGRGSCAKGEGWTYFRLLNRSVSVSSCIIGRRWQLYVTLRVVWKLNAFMFAQAGGLVPGPQ